MKFLVAKYEERNSKIRPGMSNMSTGKGGPSKSTRPPATAKNS